MYFIIKIQFIKQNISKISNSMKELLKSFNIDFDNLFKNTCIDACQAMSNSIKKFFLIAISSCAIIRSRKSSIPRSEYPKILSEISKLHFSISPIEYDELLKTTLKRWKSVSSLVDFHNNFTKQWVNSDFNNWQVFKRFKYKVLFLCLVFG